MTALSVLQPPLSSLTSPPRQTKEIYIPPPVQASIKANKAPLSPSHVPVIHEPSPKTLSESQAFVQVGRQDHSLSSGEQGVKLNRLSLATIARDKTSSVLSNLATRNKPSSGSLHTAYATGGLTKTLSNDSIAELEKPIITPSTAPPRSSRTQRSNTAGLSGRPDYRSDSRSEGEVPRATLDLSSADRRRLLDRSPSPSPSRLTERYPGSHNKMHQTSSRLLRMTEEERPFTRDFKDLFATLVVSLPLSPHRVRFQKVEHTFTSEEAINNLGSLKFSQSNRMPDPKDPSRIVTTTTTTTFSMAKEMARSVCQRFMDARFVETADGRPVAHFPLKGAVWQLTPKGMHVLTRFCQRNGINQRHVLDVLDSPRNAMQLVILERDGATDKVHQDRATIEVIFRRFAGQDGPNIKQNTSTSDSDSLSDYYNGMVGVKMAKERKVGEKIVGHTFTGKAAVDWLMDCCTTVDKRETEDIAQLFLVYELIGAVVEDRSYAPSGSGGRESSRDPSHRSSRSFQPSKNAIYQITEKGKVVAGWVSRENLSSEARMEKMPARSDGRVAQSSNNNRLTSIVNDAALRLLFREFLRDTHCEENLAFYLEVRDFTKSYDNAEKAKVFVRLDAIRESLAQAYGQSCLQS